MYAEKVAAHYDPHSNPLWGVITPTALSKVGKYGDLFLHSSCNLIAIHVLSKQISILANF